jgi:uncharacterized protein YdiU (UPF0061 family)
MSKFLWKTKEEIKAEKFEFDLFQIRNKRDQLLKESDFVLMPDYPITKEEKEKIIIYRNNLRNLPNKIIKKEIDINDFEYPEKPSFFEKILHGVK